MYILEAACNIIDCVLVYFKIRRGYMYVMYVWNHIIGNVFMGSSDI